MIGALPLSGVPGPISLWRTLPSFWWALVLLFLISGPHSVSMGSSSTRIVGMLIFAARHVWLASAFLLLRRGLTDRAGDGVIWKGLGGHGDPGSLTVKGVARFPCGLDGRGFVAAFESVSPMGDFRPVAANASLGVEGKFGFVSLQIKT